MTRGLLITLEGIDGCGKSTHAELLCKKLSQKNFDYIMVREPGGTVVGENVRRILLDNNYSPSLYSEMFLYMAARSELTRQIIGPALKTGQLVICDRFTDSTLAYQGFGGGADLSIIRYLSSVATGGLAPDLTLLLDLPVEEAIRRRGDSTDRMESKDIRFHQRVRSGYLEIARNEPERIIIINALLSVEKLNKIIWELIENLLIKLRKRKAYEL
ncbi:MAG: dTMP kinase [Bacillota bacterium]